MPSYLKDNRSVVLFFHPRRETKQSVSVRSGLRLSDTIIPEIYMKKFVALAVLPLVFLLLFSRSQASYAFQSAVEAQGDETIYVLLGEKITLMQYAENTQRDVVTVESGEKNVTVNVNGTYTFISTGSVRLVDRIYTVDDEIYATYTWNIRVYSSLPVLTEQPVSQTVYSGETAYFTLGTQQEPEFLEYQWIVTDASGMNCSESIFGNNAQGWNSPTLSIENCKSWMTGYRFYCMVKNSNGYVYTTMGPYPTLTVRKHPITSFINISGLALPQAGVKADYSAEVDNADCFISSVAYYLNGTEIKNYVPAAGDQVEIRVTLSPADERYFTSASDYTVIWNEYVNESAAGKSSSLVISFSYEVPEEGDSVYLPEESGYSGDSQGEHEDSSGDTPPISEKPGFWTILFGALLTAAVLFLLGRLIFQKTKENRLAGQSETDKEATAEEPSGALPETPEASDEAENGKNE